MILHRLEIEGLGIIGKKLSLVFPEQGRIGILGVNESGKSTLFRAIEFALFGLKSGSDPSFSRENLVTWGKQQAKVILEFSSGGQRYHVARLIGVSSRHEVHLYQVANGQVKLLESNVKEVERAIEKITGMDRDAFTKLIYIKQKELDALKQLTRARREELVNKLMGMDVFDRTDERVKEELRQLERSLELLKTEVDRLAAEHRRFQELQSRRSDLSNELTQLEEKRAREDRRVQELTAKFCKLAWLKQHNDLSALRNEKSRNIQSLEEQLNQRERLRGELATIRKEITDYEVLQTQYQTRWNRLAEVLRQVQIIHNQLADQDQEIRNLQQRRDRLLEKSQLSREELRKAADRQRKQQSLALSFTCAIISVLGIALSFVPSVGPIALVGILAAAPAYIFFRSYQKAEQINVQYHNLLSLEQRLQEAEAKHEKLKRARDTALVHQGFSDLKQIQDELDKITTLLRSQAGVTTFEALAEKIKSRREQETQIERRFQGLTALEIENVLEIQRRELREIEEKLAELSHNKPQEVEAVKFSEKVYKYAQEELENAQAELHKIEGTIKERRGALAQVERSLREFEGIAERLHAKEQEYLDQDYQCQVLKRVREELAETSRALRVQVIPYAAMLINNILPVITDSRYFRLEIDDDLKFKVSSREAGGMKERDVFSGGTQDQFLIALRLAFTQSILDSRVRADRYCLLMDECISSSDEFRKKGIFTVLEYMKKAFPQIFIIAHEDITDEVDYALCLKRGKDGFTEIASKNW